MDDWISSSGEVKGEWVPVEAVGYQLSSFLMDRFRAGFGSTRLCTAWMRSP